MDLSTLRRHGEGLFSTLARAEFDRRTGRATATDYPSIFARFTSLTSTDAWAAARESFESAKDDQKDAVRPLLNLVAIAQEGDLTASLDAERLVFDSRKLTVEGATLAFGEIPRRVANEPVRELRAGLSQAGYRAATMLDTLLSRRLEVCQRLADSLGAPSYEALRSRASGMDLAGLATQAEALLKQTDDAWRDLFDFGLRRGVARLGLHPHGDAARHDLERFERLPILDDLFKPGRLLQVVQGILEGMGLSADAQGRIEVDADGRGRPAGVATLPIALPNEIVVVLGRVGGAVDYARLLNALGCAHRLAALDPDLPREAALFGDVARTQAFGRLFESLLCDDELLRRTLGADGREVIEAARLFAIRQLGELRRGCAALIFERTLHTEGPRDDLHGLHRELYQKALAVDWPVETWLADVEPRFACATRLRASSLALGIGLALRDTANEDWWRNPRTASLLAQLISGGAAEPPLVDAALHLVRIAAR